MVSCSVFPKQRKPSCYFHASGTEETSGSSDLPCYLFSTHLLSLGPSCLQQPPLPLVTQPGVYLGMTGHWSARGWQGWGGASGSEGRGQVHVEASRPQHTQQHNPHRPLSTPRYTEPSVPGGHSWVLPLPWGPRRPSPLFAAPPSPPFCLCISPGPGLALHLSIYICANALISSPLSFRPPWINAQK